MVDDWHDISTEDKREYDFGEYKIIIHDPLLLNISESGGHRIVDIDHNGHYIPNGWLHLKWYNKPDVESVVL